ncbi:MAG: cytochrome c biogenesis protein CcsA [Chitinophagales bacterium]|nr:cytochrome c biogenesis protein CcsA [Bacteroidota bacterium]MCB9042242.1 cytochrome c biogenesis protein CcsA [Chitinophagales bacterium]
MNEIQYIGERLWLGNLGHFFTLLSMAASLLAAIAYAISFSHRKNEIVANSWRKLARAGFFTHAFSIFAIVAILFYLIFKHYFEYQYVWQHSSLDLPVYYMLSCFWEGQEGSFLLWSFWNAVLSLIIIIKGGGKWEAPVLSTVSWVQVFLATMLIGIYIGSYKLGSSPFALMRQNMPANPLFMNPEYVSLIKDGNGLNPLLQNYWMVIHPPVLFLGFSASLFPFAYSIAAMLFNDFSRIWANITLRWTLFTSAILGIGILMGGAWAYESLSFGGYWAWDPVENASLVPWIFSIAGLHTLMAYRSTGHALKSTLFFLMGSFWLVLYSTFLTRSGILGDTSVHAFTDLGMSGQLLVFMLTFIIASAILFIVKLLSLPQPAKEESAYSRELWLFVGSLVAVILATMIGIDTSWPAINKITGGSRVIIDPISHYNRYSAWFTVAILIFVAVTQYFKFKNTDTAKWAKDLALPLGISAVLTIIITWAADFSFFITYKLFNSVEVPFLSVYMLLMFSSIFAIVANIQYFFTVLKGKAKVSGASVAHVGFGLMILGVLFSAGKKEVLSINTLFDFKDVENEQFKRENILLSKNMPVQMGDYWVTYKSDSTQRFDTYYAIQYQQKANQSDVPSRTFTLYPSAQINPKMGLISNPDTRHFWDKDIFSFISSVPDRTAESEEGLSLKEAELSVGDTVAVNNALIILEAIDPNPSKEDYFPLAGDVAAGAKLQVLGIEKNYRLEPLYVIRNLEETHYEDKVEDLGLTARFEKIYPDKGKIKLQFISQTPKPEYVIMKVIKFPFINLLWLGCIIMSIGFFISLRYRQHAK